MCYTLQKKKNNNNNNLAKKGTKNNLKLCLLHLAMLILISNKTLKNKNNHTFVLCKVNQVVVTKQKARHHSHNFRDRIYNSYN